MLAANNVHGGDIYSYQEITGKKPLDYSANINPLGLPSEVKEAFLSGIDSFCSYPDVSCRELAKAVADDEQVPWDCLTFGNGAADLIYRICYALKPAKALLPAPTFAEYEQAVAACGGITEYFPLKEETGFQLTKELIHHIEGKDILFLCNPNNPTGRITERELLIRIAEKCRMENCILVIDECFIDFMENQEQYSFQRELPRFENVIVLKAFTKIFAMPGLRLGYCLCYNKEIRGKIELAGQAWSVSVPAQIAGIAALQSKDYRKHTTELISRERRFLTESLRQFGFTVYESFTNFLLLRTEYKDLYQRLYQKGILIRKCDNFIGLDEFYYRIAVKDRDSNEVFLQTMKEIIIK